MTNPARTAGLVKEDIESKATYLAGVRVFAFSHLLLVVDLDAVSTTHTTGLVVAAARDTDSIYRAMDASVQIAGNGYQVQLPPAADAGFHEGDTAPCQSALGILAISHGDGMLNEDTITRLAADLVSLRNEQLDQLC